MQNYTIEKTVDGMELSREHCQNIGIIGVKAGLCKADKDNPSLPRDISWYDEHVLKPLIQKGPQNGGISDGSQGGYDDRKMRYDRAEISLGQESNPHKELTIFLGHSHFLDYKEKDSRTIEEAEQLTDLGLQHFQDPYAFFGRNPGVTGIIMTSDKKVIVGPRNVKGDMQMYAGLLQGPAGHLGYKENPEEVDLIYEMQRFLGREAGISEHEINRLELLGLFSFPDVAGDDLDFGFLSHTSLPSTYFTSGEWKKNAPKPNHKEFFAIPDFSTLQELVSQGTLDGKKYKIVFSTRGPLAQIKSEDFE
jgi:hypothetical protein